MGINDEDGFVKQRDLRVGCELLMSTRARRNPVIFEAKCGGDTYIPVSNPFRNLDPEGMYGMFRGDFVPNIVSH